MLSPNKTFLVADTLTKDMHKQYRHRSKNPTKKSNTAELRVY